MARFTQYHNPKQNKSHYGCAFSHKISNCCPQNLFIYQGKKNVELLFEVRPLHLFTDEKSTFLLRSYLHKSTQMGMHLNYKAVGAQSHFLQACQKDIIFQNDFSHAMLEEV